ncbi:MAG: hypothetical protein KatS3mg105_0666 [Gemmatales bacterium]|nr:MAG: hypothetical protein KatS3mg105_0666 [Gemmatales bacterium]
MIMEQTREPQYQYQVALRDEIGLARLGLTTNQVWNDDPRHLLFILARYKFVSKMLAGKKSALEVGCGDAFGTRMVQQEVPHICAIDFDPVFVNDAKSRMDQKRWKFDCRVHDMLSGPVEGPFEAAYSLDVIEHIPKEHERTFIGNVAKSLTPDGVMIVGTPSIQSQPYASKQSKEGHINCKDHKELKALMQEFFENVFIFSMNDEVVHTGFYPMAHYLFALCAGVKNVG